MNAIEAVFSRHSYRGKYKIAGILNVLEGYDLVCVLPVGKAESEPVAPKKKAFIEEKR